MSTEKTITVKAADGELTIGELRALLADFDAVANPGNGDDALKPKARVTVKGRLKSVTVTVPG